METTDKKFFLTFLAVTGFLIVLTVTILVIANAVGDNGDRVSTAQIKLAQERIEPIGKVNLKSNPSIAVEESPTSIVAAGEKAGESTSLASGEDMGEQTYNGICQSCHTVGVAGAPIVGDTAAWQPRIAKGKQALYNSAINGIGIMPPKGGNPALSEEQVKAAVDYMVERSQ